MKAPSLPEDKDVPCLPSTAVPAYLDSNPSSATSSVLSGKLFDLSVLPFPHT